LRIEPIRIFKAIHAAARWNSLCGSAGRFPARPPLSRAITDYIVALTAGEEGGRRGISNLPFLRSTAAGEAPVSAISSPLEGIP
jgi:hypothetical protein